MKNLMNTQYLNTKRKRNLIFTLFKQQNNLSSKQITYWKTTLLLSASILGDKETRKWICSGLA